MKNAILAVLIILCSSWTSALSADAIVVMAETGRTSIHLEDNFKVTQSSDAHEDGLNTNVLVGYKFDNHFLVGGNFAYYRDNSLFGERDSLRLNTRGPVVGYTYDLSDRVKLVPMIGLDFWNAQAIPDARSNLATRHFSGNDPYFRLNTEFPFGHVFSLNVSYTYGNYEFGTVKSLRAGAKFEF